VTPEPRPTRTFVERHEAGNPRRVGSLVRDQPISLGAIPCRGVDEPIRRPVGNPMRGRFGEDRVDPGEGEYPGGDKAQESYALGMA
jgi:hypothetical protein